MKELIKKVWNGTVLATTWLYIKKLQCEIFILQRQVDQANNRVEDLKIDIKEERSQNANLELELALLKQKIKKAVK